MNMAAVRVEEVRHPLLERLPAIVELRPARGAHGAFAKNWDLSFKNARLEQEFRGMEGHRRRTFEKWVYLIGACGWFITLVRIGDSWGRGCLVLGELLFAAYLADRHPSQYLRWRLHIVALSRMMTCLLCVSFSYSDHLTGRRSSSWWSFVFTHLFANSKVMAMLLCWVALELPFQIDVLLQTVFVGLCLVHNVPLCQLEVRWEGPGINDLYASAGNCITWLLNICVAIPSGNHSMFGEMKPDLACPAVYAVLQVCSGLLMSVPRYCWEARRRAAFPPGGPNALLQFAFWPWFDDAMLLVGTFASCLIVVWPIVLLLPRLMGMPLSTLVGYPVTAVGVTALSWRLWQIPYKAPRPLHQSSRPHDE